MSINSMSFFQQCQHEPNKEISLIYSQGRLLRQIIFNFKKEVSISILLGLISAFFNLAISMISGFVLSHINQSGFYIYFIVFLCFIISSSIILYINELLIKGLNLKINHIILPYLWGQLIRQEIALIKSMESGDLIESIGNYEAALSMVVRIGLSVLFNLMTLILLSIFMAYCHGMLAICYLGISSLYFLIKIIFFPLRQNYIFAQMSNQGKLTSFLNEIFLQIDKIRTSNSEGKIYNQWLRKIIDLKMAEEKSIKLEIIFSLIDAIIPFLLVLSMYAILYISSDIVNTSYILQFMITAGIFSVSMDKLSADLSSIIYFLPAIKKMKFIEDQSTQIIREDNQVIKGAISFYRVSFKDPITNDLLLNDISFTIDPGQFAAFIGPSGAGKSTILKLILGLYQPCSGQITIDNHNVSQSSIKHLRKQFGVVLQTTTLLPGTIFSNIAANSGISMDQAWELAKIVNLDEEISKMPMKMLTYVSDNAGESLSGGQKQKILIARALASKPRILLLDEATSALDSQSQEHIHHYLQILNITRVAVAHRLSAIVNADLIYKICKTELIRC